MNRSLTRWAALACTSAALALSSAAAFAQASITLNDPNCLSFTLGGTAPNQTLTCVQSTTPLCTVGGPANGTLNSGIQLSATCVPAATSWAWVADVVGSPTCNGANTQQCTDTQANAGTVHYKVTGTNAQGPGPQSAAYPVVWSSTIVAPSNCTINWPSGSQASPFSYNLTVSCANGTQPFTYNWTSAPGATTALNTASISGIIQSTGTFTVQVSNSAGAPTVSGQINIGGGGGGGINCSAQGFANTTVVNENWASPTTNVVAAMGVNDAIVVKFTTGSKTSNSGNNRIVAGEYQTTPTNRRAVLSSTACDFGTGLGGSAVTNGSSIIQYFSVGLPDNFGDPVLQPNTTYYINIQNVQPPACSNTGGVCNMFVSLYKASGM